jgi:LPXTG-motif cell wall-anchored protein
VINTPVRSFHSYWSKPSRTKDSLPKSGSSNSSSLISGLIASMAATVIKVRDKGSGSSSSGSSGPTKV